MTVWLFGPSTPHSEALEAGLKARGTQLRHAATRAAITERKSLHGAAAILLSDPDHFSEFLGLLTPLPALFLLTNRSSDQGPEFPRPHRRLYEDQPLEQQLRSIASAQTEATTASTILAGPLLLDRGNAQASIRGNPIDLTDIEFEILWTLAENIGRVVSPVRLLSQVWGLQHDPQTNRVAVYMKRLRQKLPEGSIQTQRGKGYRLQFSKEA